MTTSILLIETEEVLRQKLTRCLEGCGGDVTAISHIQYLPPSYIPHLILISHDSPQQDAITQGKQLHLAWEGTIPPVIVLIEDFDEISIEQMFRCEAVVSVVPRAMAHTLIPHRLAHWLMTYSIRKPQYLATNTLSHELRTPLTAILGYTETLLGESPGKLTDIQREFLQSTYKSGKQLQKLVENILRVSQLNTETNKM